MSSLPPGIGLLPLRLFLGGTFVYAGIQKLSDAGFLHAGSPTYIGTQLQGFADGTPGGFILRTFALPHPVLAGVGVAIVEIAIGLLALTGLLTRAAAIGGMGLSLLLFLTASWHTTPYFLGPDIVFVFAWLPFVLCGAAGQPALDNALRNPSANLVRRATLGSTVEYEPLPRQATMTRRALVSEIGAGAFVLAGLASLLKGTYQAPESISSTSAKSGGASAGGAPSSQHASAQHASPQQPTSAVPSNAVKLGHSNQLAANQAATYQDPGDGNPDLIIRQADGSLTAFSAVCTHAGCQVAYSGGAISCPCHGATYDSTTGAVTGGPAPTGLAKKQVIENAGEIYAIPS
ncbi:hypothetical protein BH10ACT11_BH10ACT11_01680 [soil metagenome]